MKKNDVAPEDKGAVLIISLWVMALLAVFTMGISFRSLLEARLGKYHMDEILARYAGRAGAVKAMALFAGDESKDVDTLFECGITLTGEKTLEEMFTDAGDPLGTGSFSVHYVIPGQWSGDKVFGMMDEDRKICVNLSKYKSVDMYKMVMGNILGDIADSDVIVESLIDWQDVDSDPLPNGCEDYLPFGYPARNGDIGCLEELCLIKGIGPEVYSRLADSVTVLGDCRINVNTAGQETLITVTEDPVLAAAVISFRNGPDGIEATSDDGIFKTVDEFLNFPEDNAQKMKLTSLADYFKVSSVNFRITSHGRAGTIMKAVSYTVARDGDGKVKVLRYSEE